MNILVYFNWNCGRHGKVEGLFITTKEELERCYGRKVYFGEILGKHSEIHGVLESDEFDILDVTQETIANLLVANNNNPTLCGRNPLDYLDDSQDEDLEESESE